MVAIRTTVLVVDDDESVRQALSSFLTRNGFDVAVAADGREALELVHAGPVPNMVLLDLQMPVMSGYEVLSAMKANPAWAAIPTVILTAVDGFTAAQFGVAGLLRKPWSNDEVLAAIMLALVQEQPERPQRAG